MNNRIDNSSSQALEGIDLKKLGAILRKNLIWMITILITTVLISYLYLRYTKNVYQSDSELKLDVKQEATVLRINSFAEEENLNLISGEIEQIKSKYFLSRVIDSLDLSISYYAKGKVLIDEMYKRAPFQVKVLASNGSLVDREVYINFEKNEFFTIRVGEKGEMKDGKFGSVINLEGSRIVLYKTPIFELNNDEDYYFILNSKSSLIAYFLQSIDVIPLNFNANTIKISFKDFNAQKAQEIVNKIDSLYLSYSYEQKNVTNKQKIEWLNNELTQVEKKMEDYENYFEDFTIQNKSSDLDSDLKKTILLINKIDSQRYDLNKKVQEMNELIDFISSGNSSGLITQKTFLPPYLNQQVVELQKMLKDRERIGLTYNENTFAFRQKDKEFDNLKNQVFTQLSAIKKDWLGLLLEFSQKKERLEKEFAAMPDKNTQLSKNKRFYKLYEEFYLSMMQSKAEFEIAQAGNTPDFKILSPATFPRDPIAPKRSMIMGIGFVAGIVLNFFFIGLLYVINNKITSVHEVEKLINVPLLGVIPVSYHSHITPFHILDNPKSMVSEAIRILRTNLDFFTTSSNKKIISISSTISGEGKSFLALNLGGVLALSKKKVILLDLDMRKNKVNLPFRIDSPDKGISTVLIKKNQWQDCVVPTSLENFDYLPSGPHPPNPSELLLNGEFTEMLNEIKQFYDYVVIDTPPVGLVTDGIMAMKRSDLSIYVVRANYSKKDFLNNLQRIISINKLDRIAVVLNAVSSSRKTYGYGYYEDKTAEKKRWMNLFRS